MLSTMAMLTSVVWEMLGKLNERGCCARREGVGRLPMPSSLAFCCDAKAAASAAWRDKMGRGLVAEAMSLCGVVLGLLE